MSEERPSGQSSRTWLEKLLGALSSDSDEPSSRDELLIFLRQAASRLKLEQDAMMIIEGALKISDQQVREVLIPRSQVNAIGLDQPLEEYLPIIMETGHSRYPVVGENLDEVKGILLAKDLLPLLQNGQSDAPLFRLEEAVRPALFVPESKRLNSLLKEFQSTHNHMAIVVDEYGGTAGIITIEDILEEIVGEIEDEHDADEEEDIRALGDGRYAIRALTPIEDFNERFATRFPDEEFDTLGGLVMQRFGHLPGRGEHTEIGGWRFTVLNADGRRIRLLEAEPTAARQAEERSEK